ncbi:MAG: hypothetical protein H0W61_04305 [Bacteroidetes bacterium]|nr:hypothetical protein [Bacteroidota bacterium]
MKPSNLLFDIIKSLTPEEEGYFKQFSSLQQGDKNYEKIYYHLLTQEEYDERKIKEHFKKESFVKHFPSEKNQLLHHILRSLRHHRYNNNTEAYINEQIKNIQILYNKSLYRMARQELNKIKLLAYRHELFYSILEIIDLEKVVIDIEVRFDESDMAALDDIMKEKDDVLDKITNLQIFEDELSELFALYTKYSFVKDPLEQKRVEATLKKKHLKPENAHSSRKALIASHLCQTTALRLLHRDKELITAANATIKLFESEEAIIAEWPLYYIMTYSFLGRAYAIHQQYKACFSCLDKIRSLQLNPRFSSIVLQVAIFARSAINDSMFYLYTGQFEKHQKFVPYILNGINKYGNKIPGEERCTLHFILFMSYFGVNNYSGALVWLNKILNTPEKENRPDLYRICKLANLVIHFEMDNHTLLNYLIKANLRYYESNADIYPFEKIFVKYFRKIALSSKTERRRYYIIMKDELANAFQDPYQRFALEYFDFEAWTTSKIHNLSYAEALQSGR